MPGGEWNEPCQVFSICSSGSLSSLLSLLSSPHVDIFRSHQCVLCPQASSRIKLTGCSEENEVACYLWCPPCEFTSAWLLPLRRFYASQSSSLWLSLLPGSGNLSFPCLFGPRNGDISVSIVLGSCANFYGSTTSYHTFRINYFVNGSWNILIWNMFLLRPWLTHSLWLHAM